MEQGVTNKTVKAGNEERRAVRNSQNWKVFIPPICLMATISILSSIPMDVTHADKWYANLEPNFQNLLHIPLFALLSFLWAQSLKKHFAINFLILAVIISILFGCFDELHQMFVPGRYASLLDILLNATGAIIGVIAFKTKRLWPIGNRR